MARRLIDISVPLQAGIASDPANMLPKIEYVDHKMSAPRMAEYMGVRLDQLPEGNTRQSRMCRFRRITGRIWMRRIITFRG